MKRKKYPDDLSEVEWESIKPLIDPKKVNRGENQSMGKRNN